MKTHFRKKGWIYVPVSAIGWLITAVYAALSVATLVMIDISYNSLRSSLIRFFPYFVSLSVIFFWIASNNSAEKDSSNKGE